MMCSSSAVIIVILVNGVSNDKVYKTLVSFLSTNWHQKVHNILIVEAKFVYELNRRTCVCVVQRTQLVTVE